MFRQLLALALLGSFGSLIADDWSDFRIPRNRVFRLGTSLDAYLDRQQDGGYSTQGSRSFTLYADQRLWWDVSGNWQEEADHYLTYVDFSGGIVESTDRYRGRDSNGSARRRGYDFSGRVLYSGGATWYPWSGIWGLAAESSSRVYYLQGATRHEHSGSSWSSGVEYEYWSEQRRESWSQSYGFDLMIGPSVGRIRNVTAIADVLVMEQRLIELGVLSGEMEATTRQRLAETIYQKPLYVYLHDRYDRFFWRDVEALLRNDPAFLGQLDAYALRRISESYFGSTVRRRGWTITPSFLYYHSNQISHRWSRDHDLTTANGDIVSEYFSEYYDRGQSTSDRGYFGLKAVYAQPLGLKWQLDFDLEGFYSEDNDGYFLHEDDRVKSGWAAAEADISYQIADRWYGVTRLSVQTMHDESYDPDEPAFFTLHRHHDWDADLSASLSYFVEDHIQVRASIAESYSWSQSLSAVNDVHSDTHWTQFSIGLDYSLSGSLFGQTRSYYAE